MEVNNTDVVDIQSYADIDNCYLKLLKRSKRVCGGGAVTNIDLLILVP